MIRFGVLLILVGFLMNSCSSEADRPEVVLYVSADEHIARQIIAAFEEKTGIAVRFVGDTEAMKTTGLVNRLRREKDNPQADVFWSSEIFMTIELAGEGVFVEHVSDAAADWPKSFRDSKRMWYGFAGRPRVIAYAPDRITPEQVPTSWMNLSQDTFKDRIVMADPRFGTTGGHLAAMKIYWDRNFQPGIYEAWLLGLKENRIRLLPSGNGGVVRAIVSGEADIGMTDADDVWAAQAQGADIKLVYPIHSAREQEQGNGTLLIPNTVAHVRGGPNPERAKLLIDFLLSEEVERMLAESPSHNIPINPALAEAYPEYVVSDPLQIDFGKAAALRSRAVESAMRMLGGDGESSRVNPGSEAGDAP